MANTLPLFRDSDLEWGATTLDEILDFKSIFKNALVGTAAEALDYKVFKMTLTGLNNKVSEFIPDEYKDELYLAMDDVTRGDRPGYVDALGHAIDVIDQLKDKLNVSPFVKNLLDALLELVKAGIGFLINKKS